jgi:signal peptidase II
VLVDQLVKWWVVSTLPGNPVVLIDGILQLAYVTNSGAAFGLLRGAGSVIALVAIVTAVVIVVVLGRLPGRWENIAMGLILGGALGNLADRLFRGSGVLDGQVIDFVDFRYFPAFNVADSAITVGAALIILLALFRRHTLEIDGADTG